MLDHRWAALFCVAGVQFLFKLSTTAYVFILSSRVSAISIRGPFSPPPPQPRPHGERFCTSYSLFKLSDGTNMFFIDHRKLLSEFSEYCCLKLLRVVLLWHFSLSFYNLHHVSANQTQLLCLTAAKISARPSTSQGTFTFLRHYPTTALTVVEIMCNKNSRHILYLWFQFSVVVIFIHQVWEMHSRNERFSDVVNVALKVNNIGQ